MQTARSSRPGGGRQCGEAGSQCLPAPRRSSRRPLQRIAHPVDRADRIDTIRRGGQLAPQIAHMAVDGAIGDRSTVGVQLIESLQM